MLFVEALREEVCVKRDTQRNKEIESTNYHSVDAFSDELLNFSVPQFPPV